MVKPMSWGDMSDLRRRIQDRIRWEWREWRRPSAPTFLQEELDSAILEQIDWRQGERVLDVGCAQGKYMEALNQRGAQVTGLDINPRLLESARTAGHAVLAASGDCLPFPNASFDAVICHKTMHLFPKPMMVAREFARVLRVGGRVVFSTSNTSSPYGRVAAAAIRTSRFTNWSAANRWSVAEWQRAFGRHGLTLQALYSCNLVWPLVFRVCDYWIIPNEWMRRYNRWIRRITRLPLKTSYPLGAAMDYVVVLKKVAPN